MRALRLLRSAITLHSPNSLGRVTPSPSGALSVNTAPKVLSSTFGVGDRSLTALSNSEEEKRVARQEKLFEDLLVFEGGAVADHESLGDRMILREFLHFCMYHRKWGYYPKLFRKYRELMTTGYFDPIPFGSLRSQHDYELYVGKLHETTPGFVTPTQVFQPYYGWVLAEYMLGVMRAKFDPSEPLVIYDVGAGTGALANNVLDFLAEHYPEVYETTEYHVIEMNPMLITPLRNRLVHHYHHTKIHNMSILNWRQHDPRRCFVIGLELLSGMPHDSVVWSADGTCAELWFDFIQPDNLSSCIERHLNVKDPMILRYLRYVGWLQEESFHALKVLCVTGGRDNIDPSRWSTWEPNMHDPLHLLMTKMMNIHNPNRTAWIPTATMAMFEMMAEYLPRHHSFFADWSRVQAGLGGFNGPLVQSKMRLAKDFYVRRAAESLNSNAGMVDLCFPTDFDHLQEVYRKVCGDHKEIVNMTHPEFWRTFGGDKTSLFMAKSGYNPITEDFKLFQVFSSHHPAER
jgi:hypothetical protein